jgi:hypothetical protein
MVGIGPHEAGASMFSFLSIILLIVGTGVLMQAPGLGVLILGGGFYVMYLAESRPAREERFWSLFWLLGVLAIPIAWVAGALGL